jgi:hypothetical protein
VGCRCSRQHPHIAVTDICHWYNVTEESQSGGPEKGCCWSRILWPRKWAVCVAESSLRQPGGCRLEMPVGTRRVAVRLAD